LPFLRYRAKPATRSFTLFWGGDLRNHAHFFATY
jgi:hypothetical protein